MLREPQELSGKATQVEMVLTVLDTKVVVVAAQEAQEGMGMGPFHIPVEQAVLVFRLQLQVRQLAMQVAAAAVLMGLRRLVEQELVEEGMGAEVLMDQLRLDQRTRAGVAAAQMQIKRPKTEGQVVLALSF